MASQTTIIEDHRKGAEISTGNAICKQKIIELLEEIHLPKGLWPLDDLIEFGYNRSTGFFWIRQKAKSEHTFRKIGRTVYYATEMTAFVEDRRMKKITGVKSKELLLWITMSEMCIDDPASGKISFKATSGLGRTFPTSAFELEEEKKDGKK